MLKECVCVGQTSTVRLMCKRVIGNKTINSIYGLGKRKDTIGLNGINNGMGDLVEETIV